MNSQTKSNLERYEAALERIARNDDWHGDWAARLIAATALGRPVAEFERDVDEARATIEAALLERYGPGSCSNLARELLPINAHGMAVCALHALGLKS